MNYELVGELINWTIEAVLKPNIQQLQDIKKRAIQAKDKQLIEFCSRFEDAINNKQPLEPIFSDLLIENNKNIIQEANNIRTHRQPPEDLER